MDDQNTDAPQAAGTTQTDQERRDALRARIEAGEERNRTRSFADQAKDAADTAVDFAKKHPLATVGGAVAIGLAIGAMTKPGRRLGRKGGSLASYAADAAVAYGLGLFEGAGDKLADARDSAETSSRRLQRDAGYRMGSLADALRASRRKAERSTNRTARDLKNRFTH